MLVSDALTEVEELIKRTDAGTRDRTLRAVADLFLSAASELDDDKVAVYDEVFDRLLDQTEYAAIIDVSRRIAPVENAPPRLIRRLAGDPAIEIAGPPLEQSPRLGSDDLCDIARRHGQAHLLAISKRTDVPEPVSDILISRGERPVLMSLTQNDGARISDEGLRNLVRRAANDYAISVRLSERKDVPTELAEALAQRCRTLANQKLEGVAEAQRTAISLSQSQELNDASIMQLAAAGEYDKTVAAIALLARLQYASVDNIMRSERPGNLIILGKAVGLKWETVATLLRFCDDGRGLPEQRRRQAEKDFSNVSSITAERILLFWREHASFGVQF